MREPDVANGQQIEANQLRGNRIDGDLIGAGKNDVADDGDHTTRTRTVTCKRPIHDPAVHVAGLALWHLSLSVPRPPAGGRRRSPSIFLPNLIEEHSEPRGRVFLEHIGSIGFSSPRIAELVPIIASAATAVLMT
ncbi:MAG TPA: hypothetical protein VG871_17495 [Vicinamibacterales bacterium]|nr:hypothetical protein [Vicinamibacterales bacterium]